MQRGCGVYIFSDDGKRVILSQRGPAARHERYKWEGPGGAVDDGETFEQAARREVREELGIEVRLTGLINEYEEVIDSNGDGWHARIFRGLATEVPGLPQPDKVCGVGWFDAQDVAALHQAGLLADYCIKDFRKLGWL